MSLTERRGRSSDGVPYRIVQPGCGAKLGMLSSARRWGHKGSHECPFGDAVAVWRNTEREEGP